MDATNAKLVIGDGVTRSFILPITGWTFLTIKIDSVEVFMGPDYDIITGAGQDLLDIVIFRTAPLVGVLVTIDFVGATYVHILPRLSVEVELLDSFITLEIE